MNTPRLTFTSYQKFVVATLAFLQFTVILDFMIMPALHMTPAQFGVIVSAYAFSAGISSILSAGFADRYDRKKFLLFFYVGFLIGTLFCGLAPTYEMMLLARIVTGVFGGVIGSISMAIAVDVFPLEMRGRVMGIMQTSFAANQILGIPAGLYFSNLWGWHAPFFMIVGISAIVGLVIWAYLKPVNAHLKLQNVDHNALHHLWATVKDSRHHMAFLTTAILSTGGFMLMPFGSEFTVHNMGIDISNLPVIYLCGGIATIFIGPLVGRLADSYGKYRTFVFGCLMSIVMVVVYTNRGITSLALAIAINILLFVGIFSRMIPSQALISAIPKPQNRGSFMAVSASLQQISGGIASVIAGFIVVKSSGGALEHFDTLGYILVGTSLLSMWTMYRIHRAVPEKIPR